MRRGQSGRSGDVPRVPVGLVVLVVVVVVVVVVGVPVVVSTLAASSTSSHPVDDRVGPKLNAVAPEGTAAVVYDIARMTCSSPIRGAGQRHGAGSGVRRDGRCG
jgi:hypothetical protein